MKLNFVTCSGANEHTNIPELVSIMQEFPIAEIGIQVSEKKCGYESPRLAWLNSLVEYVNTHNISINAAVHVNLKWVKDFCHGVVAPELLEILALHDCNGDYFIKRVQLNMLTSREHPDEARLVNAIKACKGRRFILPYNKENADLVHRLYLQGLWFDCLYDESFGKGIEPSKREAPRFMDILQGYAGGISPDNVYHVLNEIHAAWSKFPTDVGIYIDAHGKLENQDTHLDLNKMRRYLSDAKQWKMDHPFEP